MGKTITTRLREADFEDLIPRLMMYTNGLLKRRVWYGIRGGTPVAGNEADDFVMQAVADTLSGQRKWQPANVDLYGHLAGVIRSKISHACLSHQNTKIYRHSDRAAHSENIVALPDPHLDIERDYCNEQLTANLLSFLDDIDPRLLRLAEAVLVFGYSKTTELTELLGIEPMELNNQKKRLRRAMVQYTEAVKSGRINND